MLLLYASNKSDKMKDISNTGQKDIQLCFSTSDDTSTKNQYHAGGTLSNGTPGITPRITSFSSVDQSVTKRRVEKAFDFYFYVVHNNEIVGRYGASLIDALSHIRLLHGKTSSGLTRFDKTIASPPVFSGSSNSIFSLPLQKSSSSSVSGSMMYKKETLLLSWTNRRSSDNRAVIPVINSRICHPFDLLSSLTLQEYILQRNKEHGLTTQFLFQSMKCCHWTNSRALYRMQYIVQREHRILQPAIYSKSQIRCNSNVVISLPTLGRNGEKDFSSRVRSKCLDFLNELQSRRHHDRLDENLSRVHVVREDDE